MCEPAEPWKGFGRGLNLSLSFFGGGGVRFYLRFKVNSFGFTGWVERIEI